MITQEMEHAINQKLQVVMGMIDMAIVTKEDEEQWESYLGSAKKAIRDLSMLIHANVQRRGDIRNA